MPVVAVDEMSSFLDASGNISLEGVDLKGTEGGQENRSEAGADSGDLMLLLRKSKVVNKEIQRLWSLMVSESARLAEVDGTLVADQVVTREGYSAMHIRVSKALMVDFDVTGSQDAANRDWAEDITAFSGDSTAAIWLEEVKKKFRSVATKMVTKLGYLAMFEKMDRDGSGELDQDEFMQVAREQCEISTTDLTDVELNEVFESVDVDGSGEVSAAEFSEWLQDGNSAASEHMLAVQQKFKEASAKAVSNEGWKKLFAQYDDDGSGELELPEFLNAVRNDCNIAPAVVSDEEVAKLFGAVDVSGDGSVDAAEFETFLSQDALAQDMELRVFANAMYELTSLWVNSRDMKQHAKFLQHMRGRITCRVINADGSVTEQLRGIELKTDTNGKQYYDLSSVDEIKSFVDAETGLVKMEGVDTRDPYADTSEEDEDPPEPQNEEPVLPPRDATPLVEESTVDLTSPGLTPEEEEALRKRQKMLRQSKQHEADGDACEKKGTISKLSEAIEHFTQALELAEGNRVAMLNGKMSAVREALRNEKDRKRRERERLAEEERQRRLQIEAEKKRLKDEAEAERLRRMQQWKEEQARRQRDGDAVVTIARPDGRRSKKEMKMKKLVSWIRDPPSPSSPSLPPRPPAGRPLEADPVWAQGADWRQLGHGSGGARPPPHPDLETRPPLDSMLAPQVPSTNGAPARSGPAFHFHGGARPAQRSPEPRPSTDSRPSDAMLIQQRTAAPRPSTRSLLGVRQMRVRRRKAGPASPGSASVLSQVDRRSPRPHPEQHAVVPGRPGEWVRAAESVAKTRAPLINAALPPMADGKPSRSKSQGQRGLHLAKSRQQERMRAQAADVEKDRYQSAEMCRALARLVLRTDY